MELGIASELSEIQILACNINVNSNKEKLAERISNFPDKEIIFELLIRIANIKIRISYDICLFIREMINIFENCIPKFLKLSYETSINLYKTKLLKILNIQKYNNYVTIFDNENLKKEISSDGRASINENFGELSEFIFYGFEKGSIGLIIKEDNLESFIEYIKINPDLSTKIYCKDSTTYKKYIESSDLNIVELVLFYGSEKIYNYLTTTHGFQYEEEYTKFYIIGNIFVPEIRSNIISGNYEKLIIYSHATKYYIYLILKREHLEMSIKYSNYFIFCEVVRLLMAKDYDLCNVLNRPFFKSVKSVVHSDYIVTKVLLNLVKKYKLLRSISEFWKYTEYDKDLSIINIDNNTKRDIPRYNNIVSKYKDMIEVTQDMFESLIVFLEEVDHVSLHDLFSGCYSLRKVTFPESFNVLNVYDMSNMFSLCYSLEEIIFPKSFNTSNVVNMRCMFQGCESLKTINLPDDFNTHCVRDMYSMFESCSSLERIIGPEIDLTFAENAGWMFNGCGCLTEIAFTARSTEPNLVFMTAMFLGCSSLKSINFAQEINTSNVTDMSYLFCGCKSLEEADFVSFFDTSSVVGMQYMFFNCMTLKEIKFSNSFRTSKVKDMQCMISRCSSIKYLFFPPSFDTSNVLNMYAMIEGNTSLERIRFSTAFCPRKTKNMKEMFQFCSNLISIEFPALFDTISVETMMRMFYGCVNLRNISFPTSFNTSNVTEMVGIFGMCESLENIILPESFDTSNVLNMQSMFYKCHSLKNILFPSTFNTSNVKSMYSMFEECKSLRSIKFPDSFNITSVTLTSFMFKHCTNLEEIHFSNSFDTSNVTDMSCMFFGCYNLKKITLPYVFNTINVKDMVSMFDHCNSLMNITIPSKTMIANIPQMISELQKISKDNVISVL